MTLGLWATAAGFMLAGAYRHARTGERQLAALQGDLQESGLADLEIGRVASEVEAAAFELGRAHDLVDSSLLWPIRVVPFVGRQLNAGRALAAEADEVASAAASAAQTALELTEPTPDGGGAGTHDPGDLSRLAAEVSSLARALEDVEVPDQRLVGPLRSARERLVAQEVALFEQVQPAAEILTGISEMVDSSTYLVLGANLSEMRLAGGMPLSVGELRLDGSEMQLTDMRNTGQLFPVTGVPVLDADVADRWGFLSPSNDYRKLGYSARFAEWSGPQAIALWESQQGTEVDGVLQLDAFVVQALLSVVGPIEVDGRTHTPEGILDYLLIGQYQEFGEQNDALQDERRDQLSLIAGAVAARLAEGGWDPIELARVLPPLVRGRHILAFSPDQEQQRAWERLGVSGRLTGDEVGVFVLNLTASKTDPYIKVRTEVVDQVKGDNREVALEVTVTNNTPPTVSTQAAGLWSEIGLNTKGSYLGRLAIYAPSDSSTLNFSPDRPLEVFGADGQVNVMVTRFELDPGESKSFVVGFTVPVTRSSVTIVPSTRFPAQVWVHGPVSTSDVESFEIQFDS